MRKHIVAGNWKMNMTVAEGRSLVEGIKAGLTGTEGVDVLICPPFTALGALGKLVADSPIALGAQDVHQEASGAYTGEVSVTMLKELGCGYVILGHSERRALFYETDEGVNSKARAVLEAGLRPIVCVGETLEQREAGDMEKVVQSQIEGSLKELGDGLAKTVIAYEPVWAVGTGKTATSEQAQEVHAFIRGLVSKLATPAIAAGIRIQYGGSVKPSNAREIFGRPDVDGGLIGGAALKPDSFVDIVKAAV